MAQRVDALDGHGARGQLFSGELLNETLDPRLQEIVAEAAQRLGTAISLVSLVLQRIQFFRAHHGLPPELEATRATDRDTSFCQFVVRDQQAFIVEDARSDDRIPKDLVERFNIQSYLGVPVSVGGEVLGSLCVIDDKPRRFSEQDQVTMVELATAASERLAELARASDPHSELLSRAAVPAFAELRNVLQSMTMSVAGGQLAVAELATLKRLTSPDLSDEARTRAAGALRSATGAIDDLEQSLMETRNASARAFGQVAALEDALIKEGPGTVAQVIERATLLATHDTKLVGGVQVASVSYAAVSRPRFATSALAWLLSQLATAARTQRTKPALTLQSNANTITLTWTNTQIPTHNLVDQLSQLLGPQAGIQAKATNTQIQLAFA